MDKLRDFSLKYLEYLNGPLQGLNLTRIMDPEEFYHKQVLDSVRPLEHCQVFKSLMMKKKLVIDVGFGGGFPLLPLALLYPEVKFIGIEARAKKAQAVQEIADHLKMTNVKTVHARLEDIIIDKKCHITLKAVGTVEKLLNCVKTVDKCTVSFYKGPNFYELEDLTNVDKKWKILEEESFDMDNTEGRMLLTFENKKVPCGTFKKNDKNLVKLSDLL